MSKKAAEHHKKAAEHHTHAAVRTENLTWGFPSQGAKRIISA